MEDLGGKSYIPEPPPTPDEKTMGMLCHLLGIFTCFIGPGVIWLIKKDQSQFIAKCAMQAIFWQVAVVISAIALSCITFFIGGLGGMLASIAGLVYGIVACIKVNEGRMYEYPVTGKFVK